MLEDLFARREEILLDMKEATGTKLAYLQDMLQTVDRALADPTRTIDTGPVLTGDPLADEWEAAIARGEMPDLNKGLPPKASRGGR